MIMLTVPLLLALTWLVTSTRQGKAMRATSQDMEAAAMMGINVNRTISSRSRSPAAWPAPPA